MGVQFDLGPRVILAFSPAVLHSDQQLAPNSALPSFKRHNLYSAVAFKDGETCKRARPRGHYNVKSGAEEKVPEKRERASKNSYSHPATRLTLHPLAHSSLINLLCER
ncbi:hypothetical protein ACFE04_021530 [Oxalis oulophora]